jgi:ion channel
MISVILSACILVTLTMWIHASGIAVLLRRLRLDALPTRSTWPLIRLLLRMIWWLILIHLIEISVWALFYLWRGCMPDAEAAFYFSGVTYTTIGYGDLVLGKPWRLLGPIEGLIGILMCGLSMGYFFVVVSSAFQSRHMIANVLPTTGRTQKEQ